jgi:hypothetical protein
MASLFTDIYKSLCGVLRCGVGDAPQSFFSFLCCDKYAFLSSLGMSRSCVCVCVCLKIESSLPRGVLSQRVSCAHVECILDGVDSSLVYLAVRTSCWRLTGFWEMEG